MGLNTLPLAEAYVYEGDTTWRRMQQLDKTENVKYRRAWTMAEHAGKVYCSTLPSGRCVFLFLKMNSICTVKRNKKLAHHIEFGVK